MTHKWKDVKAATFTPEENAARAERVAAEVKALQSGMNVDLLVALASLPTRYHVVINTEHDEDGEDLHLVACLMEEPPDGGWRSQGQWANYNYVEELNARPCDASRRYSETCRAGISTEPGDLRFWELLLGMVNGAKDQAAKRRPGDD